MDVKKTESSRKVNVALIGYGGRGQNHAQAIEKCPSTNLAAVCDALESKAEEAREAYGVETYSDVDRMLQRKDIEAVAVVAQAPLHAPLAKKVLKSGKHVLCEKPIASNIKQAVEMVKTAEDTGLKTAICYQQRFYPFYHTMKDIAEELEPLEILATGHRGIFLQKYLKEGSAYGILDTVTHTVDIVNWFMGKQPLSVYAVLRQGIYTNTDAYDFACLHINYGDKEDIRVGNIISSMAGVDFKNTFQLIGKKGNALQKDEKNIKVVEISFSEDYGIEQKRQKGQTKNVRVKKMTSMNDATLNLYEAFANYIQDKGTSRELGLATFKDGLNSLLVVEAAVQSYKKGREIKVKEIFDGKL
jgi:predicted dehydrogenase